MDIRRFRKLRLLFFIMGCLIYSSIYVHDMTRFDDLWEILMLMCSVAPPFLSVVLSHLILEFYCQKGLVKSNHTVNYSVDTLVYCASCVLVFLLSIIIISLFFAILLFLGLALGI